MIYYRNRCFYKEIFIRIPFILIYFKINMLFKILKKFIYNIIRVAY